MEIKLIECMTEKVISQLAADQTNHVIEACDELIEDSDRVRPIIEEAFRYFGMLLLKRHMEDTLKIQEMYFNHTRDVNDKTIETLKSIISKSNSL